MLVCIASELGVLMHCRAFVKRRSEVVIDFDCMKPSAPVMQTNDAVNCDDRL